MRGALVRLKRHAAPTNGAGLMCSQQSQRCALESVRKAFPTGAQVLRIQARSEHIAATMPIMIAGPTHASSVEKKEK